LIDVLVLFYETQFESLILSHFISIFIEIIIKIELTKLCIVYEGNLRTKH